MQADPLEEQSAIDADLDDVRIPGTVRFAGGAHSLAGLMAFLSGVQVLGMVRFTDDLAANVPYVFLVTGLLQLVAGTSVYRAKATSCYIALLLAILHVLGGGFWFILLLSWGVGSLPAMVSPAVSLGAGAFLAYLLPRIRKIDAARKRLADKGLSFGV